MSPRKPEATATPARELPLDLLLEIVARSDAATLLPCAACCKALRRGILSPAFIRRVCHHGPAGAAVVPPRLLGFLQSFYDRTPVSFSLAHPPTPAAARLSEKHLAPSLLSRGAAAGLLDRYEPVTSRGGLVVLRRRRHYTDAPQESVGICVYDPMTGDQTFLPDPPEMAKHSPYSYFLTYVLLTASDGIGCSFLLHAADFTMLTYDPASSFNVQTVSSDSAAGGGGKWSAVTSATSHRRSRGSSLLPYCSAVVLGGTIHWAMYHKNGGGGDLYDILTYNVGTATTGSIKLPMNCLPKSFRDHCYGANFRLASSPDGTRLTMFVGDRLRIFVWQHSAGAGWARHAVIDLEETGLLRSLVPEPEPSRLWLQYNTIHFLSSWERSGVVLFYLGGYGRDEGLIALDVETKEIHRVDGYRHIPFFPFQVDLESRLSAMKTF